MGTTRDDGRGAPASGVGGHLRRSGHDSGGVRERRMAPREGRHGHAGAREGVFLDSLPLWFEALPPAAELHKAAFEMAHELGHPVYDCLYLALAEREQALVVTADRVFAARVGGSRWRNLVENLSSNT